MNLTPKEYESKWIKNIEIGSKSGKDASLEAGTHACRTGNIGECENKSKEIMKSTMCHEKFPIEAGWRAGQRAEG